MDFLDLLRDVDDAVDANLGDTAVLTFDGVNYDLSGPFDRDVFSDETSSAGVAALTSTYSVQKRFIPSDPRGGVLVVRGETFKVVDFDDPIDGRVLLMLEKYKPEVNDYWIAGYPYTYPSVLGH